jgi:DNA-binding response OmpR family regulator
MRRASRPTSAAGGDVPLGELVVGELRLNSDARVAALGDKPLDLTAIEFDLLECLARARGRVRSREQLIESITERNYDVYDRSVDVHICSLRKKLGDESSSPRYIRTVRAVGYMFINPDDA